MTDRFIEMTLEEYQRLKTPISKYHNHKVHADGKVFDSQMEYQRWVALQLLERNGLIECLTFHRRFMIIDGFRDRYGKKHQARYYEADFTYIDTATGQQICEDVKGAVTQVFSIKKVLFLKRYPDWDLRILTKEDL